MGQPSMIRMMSCPARRTMRAGVCQRVDRNPFRFGGREAAGAGKVLEPAHEVFGEADELHPGAVGVEVGERESFEPGVLQAFDVVLDVSVVTHVRVQFDGGAVGVGVVTPIPVAG